MSRISSIAISASLIGTGALAWAFAGRPLVNDPNLDVPLNPLGINGSPYGEVFAMAMQGPIDTYFHGVANGGVHHHKSGEECESCAEAEAAQATAPKQKPSLGKQFQMFLTSLDNAKEVRTNPKAATGGHKFFLRREVEEKLRFAYQLDPSHYANYTSLHFFLTEPQLGTRPELTPSAAKLAEETIQYCLKIESDPRPALTAAAATTNILELMFNDQNNPEPAFNTTQMRQYLNLLDHCIARYVEIAKQWDETKNWDLLSPQRIDECDTRFQFITHFRNDAQGTINRLEGKAHNPQAAN
jgi:hypothetical protein